MPNLLSDSTSQKLLGLLTPGGGDASANPSARLPSHFASGVKFDDPFCIRYSVKNESWLVYLPPWCAVIPDDERAPVRISRDLSPAKDLDNWFMIQVSGGLVYVWLESDGDSESWWEKWDSALLNVGAEPPEDSKGFIYCIASINGGSYLPRQFVTSQIVFKEKSSEDEPEEPEEDVCTHETAPDGSSLGGGYDSSAGSSSGNRPHPGLEDNDGSDDRTHPGKTGPCW